MQRLVVFNNVTLDGYFTGPNGDLSWAYHQDPEWDAFVRENARGGGTLLLGRVTYEMMVSYWPTPVAMESDPVLAERMNNLPKVVFSRTLDEPAWKNTRVVAGDIAAKVRRMKQEPGEGMTILGSGTIVAQLAQAGLIDEYQLVVHPVVLGEGRTMFEGVRARLPLKLTGTRAFPNENVLLSYEAAVHATM